jgi:hypothetical protein
MMAKQPVQQGHDVVSTTIVSVIGIAVFAVLAGVNDDMGTVMTVIMWGIVLGWFLLNVDAFNKILGPLAPSESGLHKAA